MSGFQHGNTKVRSLDEELAELGLDPTRTQAEIERQTGMVMTGPSPMDPAGLREGTELPRSLQEYGKSLLEAAGCKDKKNGKKNGDEPEAEPEAEPVSAEDVKARLGILVNRIGEDAAQDAQALLEAGWVPMTEQELTEVRFIMAKLRRGAEAVRAHLKRKREYISQRGTELRKGAQYRIHNKRQMMRVALAKAAKFGKAGLAKLHSMKRRVVAVLGGKGAKKEWSDQIATLREEIAGTTQAPITEAVIPIHSEAVFNAALLARYLGEVFDALGDEAGAELFKLSDVAVGMAKDLEKVETLSDDQTSKIEKLMEAMVTAMKEYDELGEPSLGEAIALRMVAEGLMTEDEAVALMEYTPPPPSAFSKKGTAGKEAIDPSVALKYLRKINEAMQGKEPKRDEAIKVASEAVKKYPAKDHRGEAISQVEDMKGVFRTMFFLSNAAGVKAPAWMYPPGKEPWKNEVPQALIDALKGLKSGGAEAAA